MFDWLNVSTMTVDLAEGTGQGKVVMDLVPVVSFRNRIARTQNVQSTVTQPQAMAQGPIIQRV